MGVAWTMSMNRSFGGISVLKQVVLHRKLVGLPKQHSCDISTFQTKQGTSVLDEVKEIILLPKFDDKVAVAAFEPKNIDAVELGEKAEKQLRRYVHQVCAQYKDNPCKSIVMYHNALSSLPHGSSI
jgi:hypothetical protein